MEGKVTRRMYTIGEERILLSEKEFYDIIEPHGEAILECYKKEILEKDIFNATLWPRVFKEIEGRPYEGYCFKIELEKILNNILLFNQKRRCDEEEIRELIIQSICVAMTKPEVYKEIYLLIPKKTWIYRNGESLLEIFLKSIDGYKATKIEAGLEWARRIIEANGSDEIWEEISKQKDKSEKNYSAIFKDDSYMSLDLEKEKLGHLKPFLSPLTLETNMKRENVEILSKKPYIVVKSL